MFIGFIQLGLAVVKGKVNVWSCGLVAGSPELPACAPARTPGAEPFVSSCFAAFWSHFPRLSFPRRGADARPGSDQRQNLARTWGTAGPQGHPPSWVCHLLTGSQTCGHSQAQGFPNLNLLQ